jgi:predicted RNA-binding protein associated with RNAse of E/G family
VASLSENQATLQSAQEDCFSIMGLIAQTSNEIQALQEGSLAILATELAGNEELRMAVDMLAAVKSELETQHNGMQEVRMKLQEVE